MSIAIQKQIRDNSTSVSDFFQDLRNWTDEQGKEEGRREKRRAVAKGLPISKAVAAPTTASVSDVPNSNATGPNRIQSATGKPEDPIQRDKLPMPQYYGTWDRYDADAALEQLEDQAFQQQRAEKEARQAEKDRILDELAISSTGDRKRTSTARPRVKLSVRQGGRRPAPVDLAAPRKEEANRYFADGRFREAVATYTAALDCLEKYEPSPGSATSSTPSGDPGDCTGQETEAVALKVALLANRALALLKLEEWRETVADCTEALRFDPRHHKATLRRGFAFARMKRWAPAARDLERATAHDPQDNKAVAELKMARRMLEEQVKEARAHAKNVLRDPTREPSMPTRKLVVQARKEPTEEEPPRAKWQPVEELEARVTPEVTAAHPVEQLGTVGGGHTVRERQPYVPRSVRLRGRQPPPGPEPLPPVGPAAVSSRSAAGAAAQTMSFYAFEAQWARLRTSPQECCALLRRVGAAALPMLFRDSLDPELVASIAAALAGGLMDGERGLAAEVLAALARTPRFDVSLQSLSADERRVCCGLLDACAEEGALSEEELASLRKAYSLPSQQPSAVEPREEELASLREAYSLPSQQSTAVEPPEEQQQAAQRSPECQSEPAGFSLEDCD